MVRKLPTRHRRVLRALLIGGLSCQLGSYVLRPACGQGFPSSLPAAGQTNVRNSAASPQSALLAEPLFSPFAEFQLPFVMEQGANSPAQIQLLVSRDSGVSWQLYTTSTPDNRGFLYRSSGDGEYWFNLRITDALGNIYPSDKPPMRVIVDTRQPTGQMRADLNAIGQVVAEFAIHDANPTIEAVRLDFRTDADPTWREVPVQVIPRSATELVGSAVWDPPTAARTIDLRVSCQDRAKNRVELTQQLSVPRMAQNVPAATLASQPQYPPNQQYADSLGNPGAFPATSPGSPAQPWGSPLAGRLQPTPGATAWQSDAQANDFNNRPAATSQLSNAPGIRGNVAGVASSTPSIAPGMTGGGTAAQTQSPYDWRPAGSQLVSTATAAAASDSGIELFAPSPSGTQPSSSNTATGQSGFPLKPISVEELPAPGATGSLPLPADSGMGGSIPQETSALAAPSTAVPAVNGIPAPGLSADYQFSRSRAFDLEYGISGSHGSRIAAVELWATEDAGVTWERWTSDEDPANSFKVKVDRDGLHGFSVVVVGANGLASRSPRPGDGADQWIFVDTQAPKARIISAKPGEGPESGSLVIEYVCQDDNLSDRPLSLSFAENREGPWSTIATGLRNAGRYVWPADPSLPPRIYLRIEAVDQAGNVGVGNLDLPVDVESLAPRGRIQGFRPLGG